MTGQNDAISRYHGPHEYSNTLRADSFAPAMYSAMSDHDPEESRALDRERIEQNYELKNISTPLRSSSCQVTSHKDGSQPESIEGEKKTEWGERRGSGSTVQSFVLYTPDEEQAVIRRFDRRLVLFVALLYMLSFLDRSNIGNARIAGLTKDLKLSSLQYEWLLTAFYITYILFEWMTLMYRLVPPHMYIASCVASWGIIASLQSVVSSFPAFIVLRALLGISEAAFGPGVPFYLSMFFKRDELALRTGLFISAAPLATSFAGSLAWVITKYGKLTNIAPWRILFLVEGFPSIFVAVIAWFCIPDSPGTAAYLTRREKIVAKLRLRRQKDVQERFDEKRKLNWKEIVQTLIDPKCYMTAAMFFSCNVAFSSLPVFLPTIIKEMGYSTLSSQALSAPPYLAAFFTVLLTAYLSDRFQNRSAAVCFHALLGTFGYLTIAIAGWQRASAAWRYAGVYPASIGFFSAITIIITWTINNQDSDSKKGTGVAMLNLIGQLGPLLGTRLYPDSDKPYYVKGMATCAGFMGLVFILSLGLRMILTAENRKAAIQYSKIKDEDEEGLVTNGPPLGHGEFFQFML